MPKRIIDGEALWTSEKLARLRPEHQAEYAYLIPLAQGNGTFRCEPRLIWAQAYAHSRPHVTPERVAAMLDDFEQAKMLFRWRGDDGKTWGHWVGIDEPGRLPPPSQRGKSDGPSVPKDLLQEFLASPYQKPRESLGSAYPEATPGFGFGFGIGYGSGTGSGGAGSGAPASEGQACSSSFSKDNDNDHPAQKQKVESNPASNPKPTHPAPSKETPAVAPLSSGHGRIINPVEHNASRRPAPRQQAAAPPASPDLHPKAPAAPDEPFDALDFAMTREEPFAGLEPKVLRRVVFYHWKATPKPYWPTKDARIDSLERLEKMLPMMHEQMPTDFKVPGSATLVLPMGVADPNCTRCGGEGMTVGPNEAYVGELQYYQANPCSCATINTKPWKNWKKESNDE